MKEREREGKRGKERGKVGKRGEKSEKGGNKSERILAHRINLRVAKICENLLCLYTRNFLTVIYHVVATAM